jgi:hypothetical protein
MGVVVLECLKCNLVIAPEDPIITLSCGSPSKMEKCEFAWVRTMCADDRASGHSSGEGRDYVAGAAGMSRWLVVIVRRAHNALFSSTARRWS